ncbi:MAG: mechanosensitive ion channel family protein [Desulfobulbaceae bacterium]|nr:mechanosensitive ion channel family protein [Desulfobulbaceae bacterium]
MDAVSDALIQLATVEKIITIIRAILILTVGYVLSRFATHSLTKLLSKHFDQHEVLLFRRGIFYTFIILFVIAALNELGFNLGVILGAAGVFSVAIGFASQTSASNLISGLFLLGERSFAVGDIIKVGDTTGEVLSIDLLSVKIRTFDNLYVRIPNETLIKTQTTTLTKFPIRRIDLQIGIAYKESIGKVREVLFSVADKNVLCLDEPKPLFIFLGYGDSSLNIQLSVWAKRENFLELRNSIYEEIKIAFDNDDIEIPFPHRTIYTGSITEPFPVYLANSTAVSGKTDINNNI